MEVEKDIFNSYHQWKLRDDIPISKLDFILLTINDRAIYYIEKNIDQMKRLHWFNLISNPNAMYIIEKNLDKVSKNYIWINPNSFYLYHKMIERGEDTQDVHNHFHFLCRNTDSVYFFEKHPEYIDWHGICQNPNAIHLMRENREWIDWEYVSLNPNAIDLIEENLKSGDCKINKFNLSMNPNAIHLLEENPDLIDWFAICSNQNPRAMILLEKYLRENELDLETYENISISDLSQNPNAISILEKYPHIISWRDIVKNPNPLVMPMIEKRLLELEEEYGNEYFMEMYEMDLEWLSANPIALDFLMKNPKYIYWDYLSKNPAIFELDYKFFQKRMDLIRQELLAKTWAPDRFIDWCLAIQDKHESW